MLTSSNHEIKKEPIDNDYDTDNEINKLKLLVNNLINFEGDSLQELNEHCREVVKSFQLILNQITV
jgi:hypothetical protein